MQIGQAAATSGVSAKMIRHYESIGLLAPVGRSEGNYRTYGTADLHRLAFIRRARALGFPIERIRDLLKLWGDDHRSSADVKRIALTQAADLDRKIAEMRAMAATLHQLADACDGDARPNCPIIASLQGEAIGAGGYPGTAGAATVD